MKNTSSIYSASFTAASMMFNETLVVVRMLLEENSPATKKRLKEDAQYLRIQATSSRERVTTELSKRFDTMPRSYWENFLELPEEQQKFALFFVMLKTYRLLFEFQVNLALPKYNSIDRVLCNGDVLIKISEIAATDELVDSWTEQTRQKIASCYITILKQAGLINPSTGELMPPSLSDDALFQYVRSGDLWFLQACFLPQYKIEQLKQLSL